MKAHLHKIALPLAQLYWRIFKPKTFGVKVIIQNINTKEILITRHSYGDQLIWNLPGGGYRPNRENPKSAAKREIREELGLELTELSILGEYITSAEGKRDSVMIFLSKPNLTRITASSEIAEYQWVHPQTFANMKHAYKISKYAMQLLKQKEVD